MWVADIGLFFTQNPTFDVGCSVVALEIVYLHPKVFICYRFYGKLICFVNSYYYFFNKQLLMLF